MEPEKPFACTMPDCRMTFTNEDHLHVHTKKHDMVLQLGLEQKAAFVADQTPTPTRFIRNCEEVGLFQDLQNVNPFDEGFKRAMETKHGIPSLDGNIATADDVLHTPHLVFPLIDSADCALFSTTNNQRNITISRSSSDESGAVKEYETTTISKLTNEVTTISRVVGKQDVLDRVTTTDDVSIVRHEETARNKDGINETSVSYTNNIIKIHSNVEIRKDSNVLNIENSKNSQIPVTMISYSDSVIKDATNVVTKDVLLTDTNKLHVSQGKVPPIMSQRSLDLVVDSLTSDSCMNDSILDKEQSLKTLKRNYDNALNKNNITVLNKPSDCISIKKEANDKHVIKETKDQKNDDYEVIIKLPNGKHVRMKAVEDDLTAEKTVQEDTKEKLKKVLTSKVKDKYNQPNNPTMQRIPTIQNAQIIPNILPITTGTLIPVTLVNPPNTFIQTNVFPKVILPYNAVKLKKTDNFKAVKRKPRRHPTNEMKPIDICNKQDISLAVDPSQTTSRDCRIESLTDEDCIIVENNNNSQTFATQSTSKHYLESRSAASKRYRERLKETMRRQSEENRQLREMNKRLIADKAELKLIITEHLKRCPIGDDLREIQERLRKA